MSELAVEVDSLQVEPLTDAGSATDVLRFMDAGAPRFSETLVCQQRYLEERHRHLRTRLVNHLSLD